MKISSTLIFMLTLSAMVFAGPSVSALEGLSYIQRGILRYDGSEVALTAYVKNSPEKSVLVLDSPVGALAKISMDADGGEISCEGGAFFPERLARKFILRDFRAALGLLDAAGLEDAVLYLDGSGNVASIKTPSYEIGFSDYRLFEGCAKPLPQTVRINAGQYSLTLTLAKILPAK